MYITNCAKAAKIAEAAGVDRIIVDLEFIGKAARQNGLNSVKSKHCLQDVKTIADAIEQAELLVRVNPIHEATSEYASSEDEVNAAIANGAQILMLPYFKKSREVERFLTCVGGRAKTMLLLETPEAVGALDEIAALPGIDFIHVGLNDLSLGYRKKFMFELLADGTVERLCAKFREKGLTYGFGGIASLGHGAIPAEMIVKEHYRLGSTCAILSRSFCNVDKTENLDEIEAVFSEGVREIRRLEAECAAHAEYFETNRRELVAAVKRLIA